MSAIDFVVRGLDGSIRRGTFQDIGGEAVMTMGAGEDISVNLRRYQAVSYEREGATLVMVLSDGRTLRLENFFDNNNVLYLSADGQLTEVALTDAEGVVTASYQEAQAFGKWSPDDALYFTGGSDGVLTAAAGGVNETPGMLATGLLTGLGGLGGAGLAGGAAVIGGLGLLGGGDSDGGGSTADVTPPEVAVTEGVVAVGHVFDGEDHDDGVEIAGTGEPGASIVVTIGDVIAETVVDTDGGWSVVFDPADVGGGEYDADLVVVATDDSGNSTTITETVRFDTVTTVTLTEIDGAVAGSGAVINEAGHSDGVTMSGTGEVGAAITVEVAGGPTATTTVGDDGTWSVNFGVGEIAPGEYDAGVTVTAVDGYGNSATTTQTMIVDTVINVAITGNSAGADGVVNETENAEPTVVDGTSQANSTVVVTVAGPDGTVYGTQTTTSDENGVWSVSYPAGTLPDGTYDATVTAVATDAAGNSASASGILPVDTEAAITVNDGGRDDGAVINIVEAGDGVILTGATDPNVDVTVTLGGATRVVRSDADGNWEAGFAASDIPMGTETTLPITATYTDAAGNTASATGTVDVDTIVRNLSVEQVTGDGVVDATEAGTGFTLEGTTEAGAQSVTVAFGDGAARNAVVDAAGNWSITFAPGDIPAGEYDTDLTVTTVDRNDNVDSVTTPVTVDTELPESPVVIRYTEYTRGDPGVSGIGTDLNDDITGISQVTEGGTVSDVNYTSTELPIGDGELLFSFNDRVPNGSSLVVETEDAAGNENSTLVVMDEGATDIGNAGLAQFDIGAIDLSITEQSVLTLTESDLLAMSGASDTLVVHGDGDDVVNAAGAVDTGQTETIGGQVYNVYTLGEGSLIVDSDIAVNPII